MKAALIVLALLAPGPAWADAVDDYVACLIGRAAVALHAQGGEVDVDKALDVAYEACDEPADYGDAEPDGVDDMVLFTTEKIAGVRSKSWERIGD